MQSPHPGHMENSHVDGATRDTEADKSETQNSTDGKNMSELVNPKSLATTVMNRKLTSGLPHNVSLGSHPMQSDVSLFSRCAMSSMP